MLDEHISQSQIVVGRTAVDVYRETHRQLYLEPNGKSIPEEHTPLLEKLVAALEKQGFASSETDFEPKKTEILAKFWADSDLLNIQELGFADWEDFETRATDADRETLTGMWR